MIYCFMISRRLTKQIKNSIGILSVVVCIDHETFMNKKYWEQLAIFNFMAPIAKLPWLCT